MAVTTHYGLELPERGAGSIGSEWDYGPDGVTGGVNGNFKVIDTLLFAVNTDLDTHEVDLANPHQVTFAQSVNASGGAEDPSLAELEELTDGSDCDHLHHHDTTCGNHAATHETGGPDELNIACLAGVSQELQAHSVAVLSHAHATITAQGTDDHHAQLHDIASHSDILAATGPDVDIMVDGNSNNLHYHDSDRNRPNHAGTLMLGVDGFEVTPDNNSAFGNGAIPTDSTSVFIHNLSIQEDSGIFLGLKNNCTEMLKVIDTTAGTGFEVTSLSGLSKIHPQSFWYWVIHGQGGA